MTLKEIAKQAFQWFKNVEIQEIDVTFRHEGIRYELIFMENLMMEDGSGIYHLTQYFSQSNILYFEFKNLDDAFDFILLVDP